LEIIVEVDENSSKSDYNKIEQELKTALLNNLYINTTLELVEPGSIERSMGKAVRIIDKRS
jgi:phenylacetate-CoA ligase